MQSKIIDVGTTIDGRPISWLQWRVVGLCALIAILDGFDTQAIAFVGPIVATELNISSTEMGSVFAAALLGLMAGAFGFSPLADKLGRKPVIIFSCVLMGVFSLLTAFSTSKEQLLVFRFLTGLGLGGAMPNINTLTSEFAPARRRAVLMTLMFVGFPFGAVVGGLLSTYLIRAFGWESVFVVGGVAPLLLSVFLVRALPESLRYATLKNPNDPNIGKLLHQIEPKLPVGEKLQFVISESAKASGSFLGLFRQNRWLGTILLWCVFFSNLLMMYTLMSWLPTVMRDSGLALEQAILTTVIFNLGGVIGGLLIAWVIDRRGPFTVLALSYFGAALAIGSIGFLVGELDLVFIALFVAGFTVVGTQFGLNALAVSFYPISIRSTGLGWALAVGRIGAIVGPIVTGAILARNWQIEQVFVASALPAFICLAAVSILGLSSFGRAEKAVKGDKL